MAERAVERVAAHHGEIGADRVAQGRASGSQVTERWLERFERKIGDIGMKRLAGRMEIQESGIMVDRSGRGNTNVQVHAYFPTDDERLVRKIGPFIVLA